LASFNSPASLSSSGDFEIGSKHVDSDPKTSSKSKSLASPLGQRQVLEGEDAADYDQLLARVYAVVKPLDIIEEIFIADVVSLEWEVLRWRRWKWTLIRAHGLEALQGVLAKQLANHCDLYSNHFADRLTGILQDLFEDDPAEPFQTLAHKCAQNEADAVDEVMDLLGRTSWTMDELHGSARVNKAKELVQGYVRHEPDAVTLVHELLTEAGLSMDTLMANALDRLATIAESRRNASLHEIDRRRAVLGETLRRSVQEIEDGEFEEVIETTPAKGKNAA
jgi:hypothetical protein